MSVAVATNSNMAAPNANTSPSPSGGGTGAEVDERLLAKSTLDQCNVRISELTTEYAGAFVAVERRGVALRSSLSALLERMDDCSPLVEVARSQLTATAPGDGGDGDDGAVTADNDNAASTLASYSERHRLRRRTMLQHSALLELLELPNLMDACVRSQLYDEALSVAAFANTLERRHHLQESSSGRDDADADADAADGGDGGGGGGVVSGVIAEVRAREVDLRRHLIGQLRGDDVTMPRCLEIVTALRRLNGIELERRQTAEGKGGGGGMIGGDATGGGASGGGEDLERVHAEMEVRLQVDFFEARDRWLERGDVNVAKNNAGGPALGAGAPTGTSSGGPSEQLLDCIERHRTRCFEIATQFLAIFRTAGGGVGGGGGGPAIPASPSTGGSGGDDPSRCPTSLSLLSMWCTRRINLFLDTLKCHLDASAPPPPGTVSGTGPGGSGGSSSAAHQLNAASLRDALDATVFFAASMGRIGADFQSLLPPIFQPRLVALVVHHWDDGARTLDETLRVCRDAGVAGPLYNSSVTIGGDGGGAGDDNAEEGAAGSTTDTAGGAGDDGGVMVEAPPRKLLAYPPLARFVNAFLVGLNELRRCLLPGTFHQLRSHLARVLKESRASLSGNERKVNTPGFLRGESVKLRKVAAEYVDVFDATVEPYLRRALDVALGCPSEKENSGDDLEETGTNEEGDDDSSNLEGGNQHDGSVTESGDGGAVESGTQAEDSTDSIRKSTLAEGGQIAENDEPTNVDVNVPDGNY